MIIDLCLLALQIFQVEANLATIDEYYIISGAACLVNCNGISNVMGLIHKSKKLCHKYNIRFLSANISVSLYSKLYYMNFVPYKCISKYTFRIRKPASL